MTSEGEDSISSNCLINYTNCNSGMIVKNTIKNLSLGNENVEVKKKNDCFKEFDFMAFSKNTTNNAEKRRECWRKNSKTCLEKSFMSLEILNDLNDIQMSIDNNEFQNGNQTKSVNMHNVGESCLIKENTCEKKVSQSKARLDSLPETSQICGCSSKMKPVLPINAFNTNNHFGRGDKKDQEVNMSSVEKNELSKNRNEGIEKSLDDHNLTLNEGASKLKVIDCSPDEKFFQFNEQIGKGSYKNVFKGYDRSSKTYVAWCETNFTHLKTRTIEKVREEIYILSLLSHENILPLLNYWEYRIKGVNETNIVMITQYFDVGSLKNHIKTLECVPKDCIKTWGRQILSGLKYLHHHNPPILHRDLKCDNILYDIKSDVVKIGDLGYAIFKGNFDNEGVIGTPEFMAPEMFSEEYDEGVDVYAFGMCLLEMVTGEYPYQECHNPNDLYNLIINNIKPLSFNNITSNYSDVKMIIERCIRNRKNERWNVDEILDDDFFVNYKEYDVKIKACCYDDYIFNDQSLLTLEINDETKKGKTNDLDLTCNLFTFDYKCEKCFDVANRLIEDFNINVKFKNQIIKQLERYVRIKNILIKYKEIEKINEELYGKGKSNGIEKGENSDTKPNYGILTDNVFPISFLTFLQVLKDWKVNYKFVNGKNLPFVAINAVNKVDNNDRLFYLLLMHKKQQAIVISSVRSCIPERVVNLLINNKIIGKNFCERMVSSFNAIIIKIDNSPTKSLPLKMLLSLDDTSKKEERRKIFKISKIKLNRNFFSLESIEEFKNLKGALTVPFTKQQIEKNVHKNWNISINGTLNVPINELRDKIFQENGNFSLENGTLSMLFKKFTPNVFASNSYGVQFERDNISVSIKTHNFETFFNVYNKDFNKFIKKCHYLNSTTVVEIEKKIKNYFANIELTQKRALMMKKSQTFAGCSFEDKNKSNGTIMNNNNNSSGRKVNKKGGPKHFQISKVQLEDIVVEKDSKIPSRKRSITIALPNVTNSSNTQQIIGKKDYEENLKIFNDKMMFLNNEKINNEKELNLGYDYLYNFRVRRKSNLYEDIFDFQKRRESFLSKRQTSFDKGFIGRYRNRNKNSLNGTLKRSSAVDNLDMITKENEGKSSNGSLKMEDSLNSNSTNNCEVKDNQYILDDEGNPKVDKKCNNTSEGKSSEQPIKVNKLQKGMSIRVDVEDNNFYEIKSTMARNKRLYKADSLKNDCNFVDDGSIENKKKVSELSKKLAELINNGVEQQSLPPPVTGEGNGLLNDNIAQSGNFITKSVNGNEKYKL